jgi:flagellin-like protein
MRGKKGVAPIITTILLVLIVLVLASIIILWGTTFLPEALAKFEQPIESACNNVVFSAEVAGSELSVSNTGDISIYKFRIKQSGQSEAEVRSEVVNLNSGGAKVMSLSIETGVNEITVIPVLLGKTEKGKIQEFPCAEASWRVIEI